MTQTAAQLDANDPLRAFRDRFHFPKNESGNPFIYLCGNSLGLQPKAVKEVIEGELEDWANMGVEGHFDGRRPWYSYHEMFAEPLAHIVGAKPIEVVAMNSLTTNLHLLMVSFYRPTKTRYKIVIEKSAFPSDQYAVASQAKFHGFDPEDAVVEIGPREGTALIDDQDIIDYLRDHGDEVALVMLGGVNYYTGQAFDFEAITKAGHDAGAVVGFDLAHAAGNLHLKLHEWNVDFAAWCSYKYMNSGPGGVGGAFVHERFATDNTLPKFTGWWGNDPSTRFQMTKEFVPAPGVDSWQLSNAPVLSMAAHKASVDIFAEATMERIRAKSIRMTEYLINGIDQIPDQPYEIITPRDSERRGSQLSIRVREGGSRTGEELFADLQKAHVVCDYRRPDVVRIAPAPLYNSYEDLDRFLDVLSSL